MQSADVVYEHDFFEHPEIELRWLDRLVGGGLIGIGAISTLLQIQQIREEDQAYRSSLEFRKQTDLPPPEPPSDRTVQLGASIVPIVVGGTWLLYSLLNLPSEAPPAATRRTERHTERTSVEVSGCTQRH